MKLIQFVFSLVLLSSCASLKKDSSTAEWKGVNASVSGIIKAFDRSTPGGGIRAKSQNGREIISKYHNPKGDPYAAATTSKERAYAKLTILGDRRPMYCGFNTLLKNVMRVGIIRLLNATLIALKKS